MVANPVHRPERSRRDAALLHAAPEATDGSQARVKMAKFGGLKKLGDDLLQAHCPTKRGILSVYRRG